MRRQLPDWALAALSPILCRSPPNYRPLRELSNFPQRPIRGVNATGDWPLGKGYGNPVHCALAPMMDGEELADRPLESQRSWRVK
jgi:hypothetical protein